MKIRTIFHLFLLCVVLNSTACKSAGPGNAPATVEEAEAQIAKKRRLEEKAAKREMKKAEAPEQSCAQKRQTQRKAPEKACTPEAEIIINSKIDQLSSPSLVVVLDNCSIDNS
jgi:sRNA-binding protein